MLGLLGRGGMGEVYEARDRRLGRAAALKFIRGADPERVMRLLQEARAQARIDHPNVCKVYEVGEAEGRSYIAMQLVRGVRLDEAAAEMTLPAKAMALRDVALAVHEAHRLGIIHRDLKPSNVLVERADDGRWHPVVVDFGLAYEQGRGHSLTETGALLGTPAYMAPEQARGGAAGVDQRSDVYSLGATLYQLLGGAAPFEGASPADILVKVLHEDPPSLHARAPRLPADLETIALKCLSKEPARRYPSARALAEDLQRFVDGEPVLGRRPGLGFRLRRSARKHRALVAVSALSLAVTLAFAAVGLRSRLEAGRARAGAAERARLAQELGQQAKEVEWFLRAAYAMPLHDTSRELGRVRERMARIAARRDEPGAGLSHYALGRGHLAMLEFDEARAELERARAMGVDTPELHYALGRALGELYHRAFESARRSGGAAWVAERRRGLEKQYLEPALAALEQSRGLELESPRYLEGLIALYRRDFDAAERAAEAAADEAPWAYEALKLAGDAAHARATEQLGRGDYDGARAGLGRAAALYDRAAGVGRSDAQIYEALAEVWTQRAELEQRGGRPYREPLDRALEAAGASVAAAPARASGHARRAHVLLNQYFLKKYLVDGQDAAPTLAAWAEAAARAVELDPNDGTARDLLGNAHSMRGLELAGAGADPEPAWAEAVASLNKALELEPNYPWALNDRAQVQRWRGAYRLERGQDPRPAFDEAERSFRQATLSDPSYLLAYENLGDLYDERASYALERGRDPEADVVKALEAGARALALDGGHYLALNQQARAELTRAQHQLARGADPAPALARALEALGRSRDVNPAFARTWFHHAEAQHLLAQNALRAGADPGGAIEAGRRALAEALRRDPGCVDCRILGARLRLAEASRAQARGQSPLAALERARTEARAAVAAHAYGDSHLELARACLRLALAAPAASNRDAIDEGLAQADRALALAPDLARARALRGALLLARARRAAEAARLADAGAARAELARAFELNPLLRDEYEPAAAEAERLLAAGGAP